ncbi:MAG: histidine kinase dimerization/phosphoacceptor domain -containing protein [Crocinitomicaceae bacterium]
MKKQSEIEALKSEVKRLRAQNEKLHNQLNFSTLTNTVKVPEKFQEIFSTAEKNVRSYFSKVDQSSENGEIFINEERYLLIRSAALSYEFTDVFKEFYKNRPAEEANRIGSNFLFDIAHVLGKEDAKAFHKKMNLTDPIEKLSAGPVHFAFTGWANVEILPESNPSPDENFFLKYIHHNSFESQAWIRAGRTSETAVCTMNCGYSSGWCEESFGISLTAVEINCEASGGEHCLFIMAPPDRIKEYLKSEDKTREDQEYDVPVFFQRKYNEDRLKESLKQKEVLLQEVHHRVKNNLQIISSLLNLQKQSIKDQNLREEFDSSIGRVNTMAQVQDMIYGSKNVSSINIEKYFSKLIRSLYKVYNDGADLLEFEVKIEVKEVRFNPEKAIPLGLIINEIACNSFKYAFKEEGKFYLSLKQEGERYKLTVGDNGRGITGKGSKENLGMSLIRILCEQIDASVSIKNSKEGLVYKIEFKN